MENQIVNRAAHIDPILQWVSDINQSYPFVGTLLAFMAIDILVGLIAGFKKKTLSSTISHVGMSKKAVKLLLVAAGRVIEPYTGGMYVGSMIASVFIVTEGLSIVENAAICGVPMPAFFTDALNKVKTFAGIAETTQNTTVNIQHASNVDLHAVGESDSNGAKLSDSVKIRSAVQPTNRIN